MLSSNPYGSAGGATRLPGGGGLAGLGPGVDAGLEVADALEPLLGHEIAGAGAAPA